MGARTQVKIIQGHKTTEPIYLYAHWGAGGQTKEDVEKALMRKQRWDDVEYLSRIIFSEMIRDDIDGETGYGIGTVMHGDIEELIVVDVPNKQLHYLRTYDHHALNKFDEEDYSEGESVSFFELPLKIKEDA